ncbi:MAG: chemotaxis protein CheW [Symploca sp. SIO2C1]|nr:chemotaxis protein CheW [Symploca sp. SIO2C1]
MKEESYLTFSLNNDLYGISTAYVEEIFALPELTPIPEAPPNIVGLVNLRGNLVPVMDLNLSFGTQLPDYHLTDTVVVLSQEGWQGGIIVNAVHKVRNIASEAISNELVDKQQLVGDERQPIIATIEGTTGDILILSNPENWLQQIETQTTTSIDYPLDKEIDTSHNADESQSNDSELLSTVQPLFCPNATPEERAIFRQRADNLNLSIESQELKSLTTLAIIVLGNNFLGIDLEMVREFTDIRQVTPIPCCPPQIIGNMNLRGEILTLVDIRGLLNLPVIGIPDAAKAMVVEVEGIVVGIMVEEVRDAMFLLNPQEITAVPTAIHAINNEYLQGAAPYHEKMLSILDLPKILLNGGLIVDEAI